MLSKTETPKKSISLKTSFSVDPNFAEFFPSQEKDYSNSILPKEKFGFTFVGRGKPLTFTKGERKGQNSCGQLNAVYSCECETTKKAKQYTCYKLTCPICYQKGVNRSSMRVKKRVKKTKRLFKQHGQRLNFRHWALATQFSIKTEKSFTIYKRYLVRLLKSYGCSGFLVFHPYRRTKGTRNLYFSPHFHFIGVGYLPEDFFKVHGFIVRNIRAIKKNKDMFFVTRYLLSHTAVFNGRHTITWFNQFAYNKLKVINKKKISGIVRCQSCDSFLYAVRNYPVKILGNFKIGFIFVFQKPLFLDSHKYWKSYAETYDLVYSGNYDWFKFILWKSFLFKDFVRIPKWFFSI